MGKHFAHCKIPFPQELHFQLKYFWFVKTESHASIPDYIRKHTDGGLSGLEQPLFYL